jgi:hypothetical protein
MSAPSIVPSPPPLRPLAPASERMDGEDAGLRHTRYVVALTAALFGVSRLVGSALQVGLAKGWLASPSTMGWDLSASDKLLMAAASVLDVGLIVGGLLLVAKRRPGLHLLRVSICCLIVLALVGLVRSMIEIPVIRQYWSTPGAAASRALSFLSGLWLPLLLATLTLLPLTPPPTSRSAGTAAAGPEM